MLRNIKTDEFKTQNKITKALQNSQKNQINTLLEQLEQISHASTKLTDFIRSRRIKKVIVQQIGHSPFFKQARTDDEAIAFVLTLI